MAKPKGKSKNRGSKKAEAVDVDADSLAGELLARAKSAAKRGLAALEDSIEDAAAEARGATGKEGRETRSHLAWLTSQTTSALGNLARVADRERKHTGRLTMEQVLAWGRTLSEEEREALIEGLQEIQPAGVGLFGR